jgi:hypothetical protein
MRRKIVHGDDLLYRFFQSLDSPEFAAIAQRLIATMAIWLPLETYKLWPVLLPWVVRDPTCRGKKTNGTPDNWSSPNSLGYLMDDNSLIKGLPRALSVRGPKGSRLHGSRMGNDFTAAHVWMFTKNKKRTTYDPHLNSFVPNLVWLPRQVAKLTDIEGSTVQRTVQAMAYQIYRKQPVRANLTDVAEQAWALLPQAAIELKDFALEDLNWFEPTEGFYRTRSARLSTVLTALTRIETGLPVDGPVVSGRYAAGLPTVSAAARSHLKAFLEKFDSSA